MYWISHVRLVWLENATKFRLKYPNSDLQDLRYEILPSNACRHYYAERVDLLVRAVPMRRRIDRSDLYIVRGCGRITRAYGAARHGVLWARKRRFF